MSSDARLGLTPILKRLAFHYLCKGFGRHPIEHDVYDEVEVAELYPWQANPENALESGGGIRVTFYKEKRRVRWIEFAVRYAGGGGDLNIFLVGP